MGTPIERASSLYELSQKACAYNMARTWVDGMDVLAVRETLKEAVDRARKSSAPTLIEARTYRFMGHSMSDPSGSLHRCLRRLGNLVGNDFAIQEFEGGGRDRLWIVSKCPTLVEVK